MGSSPAVKKEIDDGIINHITEVHEHLPLEKDDDNVGQSLSAIRVSADVATGKGTNHETNKKDAPTQNGGGGFLRWS